MNYLSIYGNEPDLISALSGASEPEKIIVKRDLSVMANQLSRSVDDIHNFLNRSFKYHIDTGQLETELTKLIKGFLIKHAHLKLREASQEIADNIIQNRNRESV